MSMAAGIRTEVAKLPAFGRRDLLVTLSYRATFVGDVVGLAVQAFMFNFIGELVDPAKLPSFGGASGYLAFVAIGIAVGEFIQLGLNRVVDGVRTEQLIGTLEPVFASPTSPVTVQLGMVMFDLVYVPVRTTVFLVIVSLLFDVHFELSQLGPALAVLIAFIPFVWGIGVVTAAAVMTFRRGANVVGLGAIVIAAGSGAYFPLDVLPGWLETIVAHNPVAIAMTGIREALLGGAGWGEALPRVFVLIPMSAAALIAGFVAFGWALGRERRLGTLGQY